MPTPETGAPARLLRIAMFSNLFPPIATGSSTNCSGLAGALVKRGHQVVVITAQLDPKAAPYEEVDGVYVYRLPAYRLPRLPIALNFPYLTYTFTPRNQKRIAEILERHQIDILHQHNHMFDLALSSARMHRRLKKPLVVTIHTVIKHSTWLYNLILYPMDRVFLKRCVINCAHALICPDANIQEYVETAFGRKNQPLIPYGIEPLLQPRPALVSSLRQKHNLEGKQVILSLGHVHELRNRRDIVAAMPDVLKAIPNAVLLIVGAIATDIPQKLARQLGVQDAVILTGAVQHAEVPAYMALADMQAQWLCQEAPEKTSLGIAVLEGMSAGKVILTAANPNTYGAGLVRNGENLVLVQPGNPYQLAQTFIGLLQDAGRRERIGRQALQMIANNFSWDIVCEKTLAVYRDALQTQHTP